MYEAYYNAVNISRLGTVLGNRRMRLGMRQIARRFTGVGIPAERIGFMLGFQVAIGAAGREGLQPREEWFRVVKWHALAARRVTLDERTSTVWSWGWGNFGPQSVDPDKPAAACVYLWTRNPALCDGLSAAGPGFNASLTEGQIVNPPSIQCTFQGGAVTAASLGELTRLTRDRHTALTALFGRAALRARVPVPQSEILRVERRVIDRVFHSSRKAYVRALVRRRASVVIARGLIADELRRRKIVAPGRTVLVWSADLEAAAVDTAICLRDELPGTGDFPRLNSREIGVVPLLTHLRFLFSDRIAPAKPDGLIAAAGPSGVTLDWSDGPERDLAGYEVSRSAAPEGPFTVLTRTPFPRSTYVDSGAIPGTPVFYAVRAVDTSLNRSERAEASAA